jgi:adenine-specific DNA-methyltransferase
MSGESSEIFTTPGTTTNFLTEFADQLAILLPEAVADGKIDAAKLEEYLGGDLSRDIERFGLFWPGKKRALHAAQEVTSATLRPNFESSRSWETTENVFIEGDNLEVLKILQKHYHAKVKMIYIDPPYNTGKDFIYPDNYKEGLDSYLKWSHQVNEEGRKLSTNSETEGRYHSNWLNMMYPRLKLARNLLKTDGQIFVSINDAEMPRLRMIMDEIFGADNFIAQLIWLKGKEGGNDNPGFGLHHEYILCYGRSKDLSAQAISLDEKDTSRHVKELPEENLVINGTEIYRDGEYFQLVNLSKQKDYTVQIPLKGGKKIEWPSYAPQKTIDEFIRIGKVFVGQRGVPYIKSFLADEAQGQKPSTIVDSSFGTTKAGGIAVRELFGSSQVFSYPKPPSLIKRLISLSLGNGTESAGEIVLDFFAGSGTTAQAIYELNSEDGGSRRYILVQLPEPIADDQIREQFEIKNLAQLARVRIQKSAEAIIASNEGQLIPVTDLGFRSYSLVESNFSKWCATSEIDPTKLEQHILELRESSNTEATSGSLLTEILLKQGYSLTESIGAIEIEGLNFQTVGENIVIAYLDKSKTPTLEQLYKVLDLNPIRFIILEDTLLGNDELKTNLVQYSKSRGIELWTA